MELATPRRSGADCGGYVHNVFQLGTEPVTQLLTTTDRAARFPGTPSG